MSFVKEGGRWVGTWGVRRVRAEVEDQTRNMKRVPLRSVGTGAKA